MPYGYRCHSRTSRVSRSPSSQPQFCRIQSSDYRRRSKPPQRTTSRVKAPPLVYIQGEDIECSGPKGACPHEFGNLCSNCGVSLPMRISDKSRRRIRRTILFLLASVNVLAAASWAERAPNPTEQYPATPPYLPHDRLLN